MSMTKNEASERAIKIWGESAIVSVEQWSGTGDSWHVATRVSERRQQPIGVHTLDGNGHTTCHDVCAELEQLAYPSPAVSEPGLASAHMRTAEPSSAAPIVEPTAGQSVSAGLYLEMCERFGTAKVQALLTATAGAARAARPLKLDYAMLVYQAGIANVFQVDAIELTAEGRNARRMYQGDFRGAEIYACGLASAGVAIRSAGCNMAGDITDRVWTFDLDSLPFSDKFNPIHEG